MSINKATWQTGNLSGTIDGNTITAQQLPVGYPGGSAALGGATLIPGTLYTLSGFVSEAVATLQTSTWFDLKSQPGAILELHQASLYMGSLSVELTNDGTNIYPFYQDNNPTIGQSLDVALFLPLGFRFVRVKATPTSSNVGTLKVGLKVLGQDALAMVAGGQYPGVMYTGSTTILAAAARTSTINTTYDFKVPMGAVAFNLLVNQTALTGTSATYSINRKDPLSGTYSSTATYSGLSASAISSSGIAELSVGAGQTATANVSISSFPGTHWGLVTTGTNSAVTSSACVQFTF